MTVSDILAGFDTLAATRGLEAADIERRRALEARMLKVAVSIVPAQTALTFGLLKLLGGAP